MTKPPLSRGLAAGHGPPLNYNVPGLSVCLGGVTLPATHVIVGFAAEWAIRRYGGVYPAA